MKKDRFENLPEVCLAGGFTNAAFLDPSSIELKEEVRRMCAMNTCGMYGKNWSCPPNCGSLEAFAGKIRSFPGGVLVQTTKALEDAWDYEAMMEAERAHKVHFRALAEELSRSFEVLAMGTGGCTICGTCTCPDEPCRFPDRSMVSMEACGMVVSEVCGKNGLTYYYGPQTVTFTGCFLLKEKRSETDL